MNVSLTPELEKLVNEKVKSGKYTSASEVVREGLRLLQDQDDAGDHGDIGRPEAFLGPIANVAHAFGHGAVLGLDALDA